MKNLTIFFFIISMLLASTISSSSSSSSSSSFRSRFLAGKDPKNKKCDIDPSVCYNAGSGGPNCCGQQCVDTNADVFNCGKCGKICKFTEECCGGKCVDLSYDKRNCGSCFHKCMPGIKCFYGMCHYA